MTHPIDRMALLKEEIAALKARMDEKEREYSEWRRLLVSGQIDQIGETWFANVEKRERRSISVRTAEGVLPPAMLAAIVKVTTYHHVKLERRPVIIMPWPAPLDYDPLND